VTHRGPCQPQSFCDSVIYSCSFQRSPWAPRMRTRQTGRVKMKAALLLLLPPPGLAGWVALHRIHHPRPSLTPSEVCLKRSKPQFNALHSHEDKILEIFGWEPSFGQKTASVDVLICACVLCHRTRGDRRGDCQCREGQTSRVPRPFTMHRLPLGTGQSQEE